MKYSITSSAITKQPCDCLIVAVYAKNKLSTQAKAIDEASNKQLTQILRQDDLKDSPGGVLLLHHIDGIKAKRVLLVNVGEAKKLDGDQYSKVARAALGALNTDAVKTVCFTLTELDVAKQDSAWKARQTIIEHSHLLYRFEQHKSKSSSKPKLTQIILSVSNKQEEKIAKAGMQAGLAISHGMTFSKDLGNTPANICNPTYLATQAKKLSDKQAKLSTKVLDEAAMKKLGMGSLLSVSAGSNQPAKLIIVEYKGGNAKQQPIVLVGKGVTFDSGGLSLKPAANMMGMKYDMMGAASVLGALKASNELKLKQNIIGVIAATENLPNKNATKPGDIVKSMSGQTIEINNTDAEGRLILCDALTYCERFKPACVVDVATLTGAITVALGYQFTGVFSNDDRLAAELVDAGNSIQDLAWHLPMHEAFDKSLNTDCADMANIGDRWGGSSVAANFLARFTKNFRWAHLDIAGTAWPSGSSKLTTGRPVPMLMEFLINYKNK